MTKKSELGVYPSRNREIRRAEQYLDGCSSVYVVCHIIPDGDAIGSLLGLGLALKRQGKVCTMACADPVPAKLRFLPGVSEITASPPAGEELLISVDASDVERLGAVYDEAVFRSRPLINIDHHITNSHFGVVNLVDLVPSTAEVVLSLLKKTRAPVDKDIATALMTGLVTDTRCFRTGNVSVQQLRTCISLMRSGASLADVTEYVFNREPASTICLWGEALHNVQRRETVIWTEIDQTMLRKCGASPSEGDGLVSFLAGTEGADVAIVFREKDDGRIEASMRAGPNLDVSFVASELGGGGHQRAAGVTMPGKLRAVRERVLAQIDASLKEQKRKQAAETAQT